MSLSDNKNHLRAGEFAAATDRVRDFPRLAETDANAAFFVADDNERAEIEPASALDDLGGAVDEHHLLDEFLAGAAKPAVVGAFAGRFATAARRRRAIRAVRPHQIY